MRRGEGRAWASYVINDKSLTLRKLSHDSWIVLCVCVCDKQSDRIHQYYYGQGSEIWATTMHQHNNNK